MNRNFIFSLVVCLLLSSTSVYAAPQAIQRVAKALKTAVVSIAVATTIVAGAVSADVITTKVTEEIESERADANEIIWIRSYLPTAKMMDLWISFATGGGDYHGQGRLGFSMVLAQDKWSKLDYGFLQGEVSVDDYPRRLPFVRAHLIRDTILDGELPLLVTSTGYDYFDFRADDLGGEIEGFTAHHVHLYGVETPVFSSSIGIGDLGFAKLGNFSQADLNYWAGDNADLSYILFHRGSLGIRWMPSERWAFNVDARQLRTIGGDIDFTDGTDGNFTAIWEEIALKSEFDIHLDQVRMVGELRFYRQRIDADDEIGNSFSSRQDGKKGSLKFQLLFD